MVTANSVSRRQFLTYGAVGAAGLVLPGWARADSMGISTMMRLNPNRFLAGLMLDLAKAVVVKFAADEIVNALVDGKKLADIQHTVETCAGLCSDRDFRHANYKAAVVTLGIADYQAWKERLRARQLEVLLHNKAQLASFQSVRDYLRDEGIRIRLAGMEYSRPVGQDITPDDLLTLDGALAAGKYQERHYQNLLALTQTRAFVDWSV